MKEKMHKGVKIFLIGEIFMIVSCFSLLATVNTELQGLAILGIFAIVALILNLIGIVRLSKVNSTFKAALWCIIIGLILSIVSVAIGFIPMNDPTIALKIMGICECVDSALSVASTILIIEGINRYFKENSSNVSLKKFGVVVEAVFAIGVIIGVIIGSILPIFTGIKDNVNLAKTLTIVSAVVKAASFVLFFVYLCRATKATK